MKNHKGMIAYIIITLVSGLMLSRFGVSIFTNEGSSLRWFGLLIGSMGVGLVILAWAWASAVHFEVARKEAWWAINKFLPRRYTE